MRKGTKEKRRKTSLQTKQIFAFSIIIICFMTIMLVLHIRTVMTVRQMTYDKMRAQAEYYLDSYEVEINHAINLQFEFFNDRKLAFLAQPNLGLDDYEKRDALLAVKEKLDNIAGVSNLVESCTFYIPKSEYKITPSAVRRMDKSDFEDMEEYMKYGSNSINYAGNKFFSVEMGQANDGTDVDYNFVFVLTFSTEQIEKQLEILNTAENSGIFIYNEKYAAMLENSSAECSSEQILKELKKDENGEFAKVQEVTAGGGRYLVFVGGTGAMGLFVQYTEEDAIMSYISQSWIYLILCLIFMIVISAVFILYTNKIIHKPMTLLMEAFGKVKEGNLEQHIYRNEDDEFAYLYNGFNDMEDQLRHLIDEVYVQTNLAQKAQLKQLQAQINPHFLYNSFFTLSRRIKRQDYENAEEFAKHLGNYFRYLTRNGSDYIPLGQEVAHAKSYAAIQGVRFAGRLSVEFGELPEEYAAYQVPRLILQPLLENAFEHGLENRISDGLLRISFSENSQEFRITVEDNGEEASDSDIEQMRKSLSETEQEEVTGIVNIHRRLQFYFKNKAGLSIARSQLGGVAVSIWILPEIILDEGQEKPDIQGERGQG